MKKDKTEISLLTSSLGSIICINDVQGFNCEVCQAGYYGDAVFSQCKECTCDMLGTDPAR